MEDFMKILNGWYLDSMCLLAWKKFNEEGPETFLLLLDNLKFCLENEISYSPYRKLQGLFINFLADISYLHNLCEYYAENKEDVAFVLSKFNKILDECPEISHTKNLELDIARELIYSFCRSGDFKHAKKLRNSINCRNVLDKLHSTDEAKELIKEITDVLKFEDLHHQALNEHSYEKFIIKMKPFLKEIYQKIPIPFLYNLYERFLKEMKIESVCQPDSPDKLELSSFSNENDLSDDSCVMMNSETAIYNDEYKVATTPNASPISSQAFDEPLSSFAKGDVLQAKETCNIKDSNLAEIHTTSRKSNLPTEYELTQENEFSENTTGKMLKMFNYFRSFQCYLTRSHKEFLKSHNPLEDDGIDIDVIRRRIQERFTRMGILQKLQETMKQTKYDEQKSREKKYAGKMSKELWLLNKNKVLSDNSISPDQRMMREPIYLYPSCLVTCIRAEQDHNLSAELRDIVRKELQFSPANVENVERKRKALNPLKSPVELRPKRTEMPTKTELQPELLNSPIKTPPSKLPLLGNVLRFLQPRYYSSEIKREKVVIKHTPPRRRKGPGRKGILWNEEDTYKLFCGIQKYGPGKWSFILKEFHIPNRTGQDLADKWRNLQKNSQVLRKLKRRWLESLRT